MSNYPGDEGRDEPREESTQPLGWQQPDPQRGWDAPGSSGSQQSWDAPQPSPYTQAQPPPYSQAPPPYSQAQPPSYGGAAYSPLPPGIPMTRPDHPQATLALVLGIVGLAGGLATCGLLFVTSPFAWVIGRRSLREIAASQGQYGGEGSAKAGYITGVIGTVLLGLALVAVVLYVIAMIALFNAEPSSDYGNV